MSGKASAVEYNDLVNPDDLAIVIANYWSTWKSSRAPWEQQKLELRNYIFATDTSTTTNSSLPWKNTTTRPKLTQIRDNLHANYMAALFPHDEFFEWEANEAKAADLEKRKVIEAYMSNKLQQSKFIEEMSKLVLDYIDYGNAFGQIDYVTSYHKDGDDNQMQKYVGPKLTRISPFNIVFDVTASSFHNTPHIIRSVMSMGQLKIMAEEIQGSAGWIDEAFKQCMRVRSDISNGKSEFEDTLIKAGIKIDGFGDMYQYYNSPSVEVLTFQGDLYDAKEDKLYRGHKIVVVDRAHVVYNAPMTSWLGRSNVEHVGWRLRPDNLLAMGPLDNLVGMQYRIDHLENLRADVFDQIAHPVVLHKGEVEDWQFGPGARIFCDIDADVQFLRPDSVALNADFQIRELEEKMEEMAGAPRQAMGVRTPGEKTAHEVQTLENNAGRIFQHKTAYYDRNFVEPCLNQMLASARENLDTPESIRIKDADYGTVLFESITKDDILAKGTLVPKGAQHFARKAQVYQNLNGFMNSAIYQDDGVKVHLSGKRIAQIAQELLDLDKYEGLVVPNVRVAEMAETTMAQTSAQRMVSTDASINPELEAEMAEAQAEGGDLDAV